MKLFIFTCLLVLSLPLNTVPKESLPDFYLLTSEKDPSLDEKAMYVIHFDGLPVGENTNHVLWSIDNKGTARASLDAENTLKIKTSPGTHSFQFFFDTDYTEIQVSNIPIAAGFRDTYVATFQKTDIIYTVEKPVIYLYPEASMQVEVKVQARGKMLFTYPALNDAWKMTAHPGGELEIDGKMYPYLFWEAENPRIESNWREGTLVEREKIVEFLEAQLDEVGLNARESADFITYWAPRMMQHPKCVVHFLQNNDCAVFGDLNVLPEPNEINRLYILWSGVDNFADYSYLRPQKLQKISRLGFDLLEWGGVEMFEYPVNSEEL